MTQPKTEAQKSKVTKKTVQKNIISNYRLGERQLKTNKY